MSQQAGGGGGGGGGGAQYSVIHLIQIYVTQKPCWSPDR